MYTTKEQIAELASMLPMFIEALLDGIEIKKPAQVNYSEGKTLMMLYKHEGNPMADYSKKVGLSKGSFTAVADRLESKGLIKRMSVCSDRRKSALVLTDEGKCIAKKIDSHFNEHISKKVGQLEEEDLDRLKNALETMASIMQKIK